MSTTPSEAPTTGTDTPDDGWKAAGSAWGHAAADWAYLWEPSIRDAADHIFDRVGLGPGTELLDVACGSGYAAAVARRRGASTTGIDASTELVEIAKRRDPAGDYRAGDMFDLPYDKESFDVVTAFNGIWGGCEGAIAEAARVTRPGGWLGITFWGPGRALDLRDWFLALGSTTNDTKTEMIGLASIGSPGIAEKLFTGQGFNVVERGASASVLEFADEEIAWQALRSPGLVKPALDSRGDDALRDLLLPAVEQFRAADGSYRIVNELTHVIGQKPG